MASPNLFASDIMDLSAARLNDVSRSLYTYTVQIPFLNLALLELQEIYEANNAPTTDQTSATIQVNAATGIVSIPFDDGFASGVPGFLPDDLIEIKVAWQSTRSLNQWTTFSPIDYLPEPSTRISSFLNYQWATDCMKVNGANANNDIKLDYIRSLFVPVESEDDELLIINGKSFLVNRTASYVAQDIMEDEERATTCLNAAYASLDNSLTIVTKGRQKIQIRRRPFRAGFKSRSSY